MVREMEPRSMLGEGPIYARDRLLKAPEVVARTTLSRAALYQAIAAGAFPRPVRLSANRVAWPESHVDAWIAAKVGAAS